MFPSTAKGYVIRALHEWCLDSGFDPYILVHTDKSCTVPSKYVQDGLITFNVGYESVKDLQIGNEWISFVARFAGVPFDVSFPLARVAAFYSKQTQEGMMFEVEKFDGSSIAQSEKSNSNPQNKNSPDDESAEEFGGFKLVD